MAASYSTNMYNNLASQQQQQQQLSLVTAARSFVPGSQSGDSNAAGADALMPTPITILGDAVFSAAGSPLPPPHHHHHRSVSSCSVTPTNSVQNSPFAASRVGVQRPRLTTSVNGAAAAGVDSPPPSVSSAKRRLLPADPSEQPAVAAAAPAVHSDAATITYVNSEDDVSDGLPRSSSSSSSMATSPLSASTVSFPPLGGGSGITPPRPVGAARLARAASAKSFSSSTGSAAGSSDLNASATSSPMTMTPPPLRQRQRAVTSSSDPMLLRHVGLGGVGVGVGSVTAASVERAIGSMAAAASASMSSISSATSPSPESAGMDSTNSGGGSSTALNAHLSGGIGIDDAFGSKQQQQQPPHLIDVHALVRALSLFGALEARNGNGNGSGVVTAFTPHSPPATPALPQRPEGIEQGRYPSVSARFYYDVANQVNAGASALYRATHGQRFNDLHCVQTKFGLTALKQWVEKNVFTALQPDFGGSFGGGGGGGSAATRALLRGFPPVDRALFTSPYGSGVSSFMDAFCQEMHVNLVVISHVVKESGMLGETLTQALMHRPCIVLFDRCTPWFDTDANYLANGLQFMAMHQCKVNEALVRLSMGTGGGGGGGADGTSASTMHGQMIAVDRSYVALPNFWMVFSHTSDAPLSDEFLKQFSSGVRGSIGLGGGAVSIAPPTAVEREQFLTLYVKQLLYRFELARTELELVTGIGQLRELIADYTQVFDNDVPGFMVKVIEDCLHILRDLAASSSGSGGGGGINNLQQQQQQNLAASPLGCFPSADAVRLSKMRLIKNAEDVRAVQQRSTLGMYHTPPPSLAPQQQQHHQQPAPQFYQHVQQQQQQQRQYVHNNNVHNGGAARTVADARPSVAESHVMHVRRTNNTTATNTNNAVMPPFNNAHSAAASSSSAVTSNHQSRNHMDDDNERFYPQNAHQH